MSAPVAPPRILAVMGSGETAPTMTTVHADLLARLGPPPVPAVLLDTPFGFQENAPDISQKAMRYFEENVRHPLAVASWRDASAATPLDYETMLARLREAHYIFAGPGSPSYALRQWRGSAVPEVLAEKLRTGGCVVFSSAAACTLGRFSLPVYEVYKVGEPVRWLDGLNLCAEAGLDAVVIPHYNNAEGGTHDTRYCYMGARRLAILEEMLPEGCGILGVDEHTACILDLDAQTATVRGNGAVTVRRHGREWRVENGTTVPLGALGGDGSLVEAPPTAAVQLAAVDDDTRARNPFMDGVAEQRAAFDTALSAGDVDAALAALLALDSHLWDWSRDTLDSDDMDRARSLMRTMLVRLGETAHQGVRDPRDLVAPFVEAILAMRRRARAERRFADADALRDALLDLGVEVRDSRDGTEWDLRPAARPGAA